MAVWIIINLNTVSNKLSIKSRVILNKSILKTSILEDDILFDSNNGTYFRINKSGKFIMDTLSDEIIIDQIVIKYQQKFKISMNEASNDVLAFIELLAKKNFINIV